MQPPRVHILHVPGADERRDAAVAAVQESDLDVCIHADPHRRGAMATWLDALECAHRTDTGRDWSAIIQDDAVPIPGWEDHLVRACGHSPEPLLSLTYYGKYGEALYDAGVPYGVGVNLIWGCAVAYHRSTLRSLWRFAHALYTERGYKHDDRTVGAYALRYGRDTAVVTRSLFRLAGARSLLGHPHHPQPIYTIADDGPPWELGTHRLLHIAVAPEVRELAAWRRPVGLRIR